MLTEPRRLNLKPPAFVVLDGRGAVKAAIMVDGTGLKRFEVAHGKAYGALVLVPGGVLARAGEGRVLAAIGVSGDTSDNDKACPKAGIEAAGLMAGTG